MPDLLRQLLEQIQTGRLDDANATMREFGSVNTDPAFLNRETLTVLKQAWTLAVIQRSHIRQRLRVASARRLYDPGGEVRRTWQIDA